MERSRGIWCTILTLVTIIVSANSCNEIETLNDEIEIEIHLRCTETETRALLPDEEHISDVSLMIFDRNGALEKYIYQKDNEISFKVSLLKGVEYTILTCVNFGYQTKIERLEEKDKIMFHLAYPDEYQDGIPMSGIIENVIFSGDSSIEINLERLMACISIKMDRSRLSDGVNMDIIGLKIGNCPKSMTVFSPSRVNSEDGCFTMGFSHNDIECGPLNTENMNRISEPVSLYMLENLQGTFSTEGLENDDDKVLDVRDPRYHTCSFIEMELEYSYREMYNIHKPLIYRFYLGENLNSLDVERNCRYHITVCPEDDGLRGDGWRVDKSGIGLSEEPRLVQYPDDYIIGNIGDVIHLGCRLRPSDTPFEIGIEYLEADKQEGIYEYEIDSDGHGVTLTLTGPGRGLIYMEAGDPINDAALFLIEVNLPD